MISTCVVDRSHARPIRAFTKRGVDIYTCRSCGSIMADIEFVHEQYEDPSYYTLSKSNAKAIADEWRFRWTHVLNRIKQYVAQPSILDVGAGNGYFVHLAREMGLRADGVEISDAECAYAKAQFGVELMKPKFEDLPSYDAVCSFNVIEHVPDPAALLEDMSSVLVPGGYIFITTPSPACVHRRVKGLKRWAMVCPPHHINLFTKRALRQLLSRGGFDVVHYESISTYIRFARKLDGEGLLIRRTFFHILKSLGMGADHFIVARKRA